MGEGGCINTHIHTKITMWGKKSMGHCSVLVLESGSNCCVGRNRYWYTHTHSRIALERLLVLVYWAVTVSSLSSCSGSVNSSYPPREGPEAWGQTCASSQQRIFIWNTTRSHDKRDGFPQAFHPIPTSRYLPGLYMFTKNYVWAPAQVIRSMYFNEQLFIEQHYRERIRIRVY